MLDEFKKMALVISILKMSFKTIKFKKKNLMNQNLIIPFQITKIEEIVAFTTKNLNKI